MLVRSGAIWVATLTTALTPRDWETRELWRSAPYHGVINVQARGMHGEVLTLDSSDRIYAYNSSECGTGVPVGTSFSPRQEDALEYFEVHILSHAQIIPLCFQLHHNNDTYRDLKLQAISGEHFVFNATAGDFANIGNGWGLPTPDGIRTARAMSTAATILYPAPTSPSQNTLCHQCTRDHMIIDPFCLNSSCASSSLLETTYRMFSHVLVHNDPTVRGLTKSSIDTCVASLHFPHDRLTREDVVDYARQVLVRNAVPLSYGCS